VQDRRRLSAPGNSGTCAVSLRVFNSVYARTTGWLCAPKLERHIALLAFLCALPSLGLGLHADDFVLRQNLLEHGPLEAFTFWSRDPQTAQADLLESRSAGLCFALSLLSAELGACTLGYLVAHALTVDRESSTRRALAMLPYGVLTGVYLAHYVMAGYGVSGGNAYRDFTSAPSSVVLAWLESIPLWLATTATLPIASFQMIFPDLRIPLLLFSLVALAILLPLLGPRSIREPHQRMFAIGAVLSLLPLAVAAPQERLRFLVAFGVYGLLGPWIASEVGARERFRRGVARFVWVVHGVVLPVGCPVVPGCDARFSERGRSARVRAVCRRSTSRDPAPGRSQPGAARRAQLDGEPFREGHSPNAVSARRTDRARALRGRGARGGRGRRADACALHVHALIGSSRARVSLLERRGGRALDAATGRRSGAARASEDAADQQEV
jgi:hypothetical protein